MDKLYGKWLPIDLSVQGAKIDLLINLLHVFMVLLFVGWGIFMIYCLVQFRQRPGHKAIYQPIKAGISKWLEIGIVIFEAIILIGISFPAWSKLKINFPDEKDAVVVKVVAQQFAWNFHYAGPDGKFGKTDPSFIDESTNPLGLDKSDPDGKDDITTINQLVVPAGKKILIKLTSKDVIHSFTIPVLRVKQDALPGMEIPVWFEAKAEAAKDPAPGEEEVKYDIACAQLCGLSHFKMQGYVAIRTEAGFAAWLKAQGASEEFTEDSK